MYNRFFIYFWWFLVYLSIVTYKCMNLVYLNRRLTQFKRETKIKKENHRSTHIFLFLHTHSHAAYYGRIFMFDGSWLCLCIVFYCALICSHRWRSFFLYMYVLKTYAFIMLKNKQYIYIMPSKSTLVSHRQIMSSCSNSATTAAVKFACVCVFWQCVHCAYAIVFILEKYCCFF